jgi:hypothetical protein
MQKSNIVVTEVDVTNSGQCTNDNRSQNVDMRRIAMERAKKCRQAFREGIPFFIRNIASKNDSDLFGNRVYSLQELSVIGRHGNPNLQIMKGTMVERWRGLRIVSKLKRRTDFIARVAVQESEGWGNGEKESVTP